MSDKNNNSKPFNPPDNDNTENKEQTEMTELDQNLPNTMQSNTQQMINNSPTTSDKSLNSTGETDFTLAYCLICQTTGQKGQICSTCENVDITYKIPVIDYKPPNSETHEDQDFDINSQNDSDKNDYDTENNSQNHDHIEDFLHDDSSEDIAQSKE